MNENRWNYSRADYDHFYNDLCQNDDNLFHIKLNDMNG